MAGNNDLRIKITAGLNLGKSLGDINKDIKALEKSINKLNLKIKVDEKILNTITKFNQQIQNVRKSATDANKVIEQMTMQDGTKVTRTYFNGMKNEFSQIVEGAKNTRNALNQTTDGVDGQRKSVSELTKGYTRLNEQIRKTSSNAVKDVTTKYLDNQGNARVIKTDASNNVINVKDINNYKVLTQEQDKARKSLQELWRTGKLTKEELKGMAKSVNTADSVKQIDILNNKLKNIKIGSHIKQEQERLTQGFKKLFDQGKIGEKALGKINKSINSAKNIQELDKIQRKLQLVTNSANNKQLQQKLIGDAQTLLRTHSKTVDKAGINKLIAELNRIPVSARNASNALARTQNQLRNFQQQARESARSSMTIMDAFRTAMVKFCRLVW